MEEEEVAEGEGSTVVGETRAVVETCREGAVREREEERDVGREEEREVVPGAEAAVVESKRRVELEVMNVGPGAISDNIVKIFLGSLDPDKESSPGFLPLAVVMRVPRLSELESALGSAVEKTVVPVPDPLPWPRRVEDGFFKISVPPEEVEVDISPNILSVSAARGDRAVVEVPGRESGEEGEEWGLSLRAASTRRLGSRGESGSIPAGEAKVESETVAREAVLPVGVEYIEISAGRGREEGRGEESTESGLEDPVDMPAVPAERRG